MWKHEGRVTDLRKRHSDLKEQLLWCMGLKCSVTVLSEWIVTLDEDLTLTIAGNSFLGEDEANRGSAVFV